MNRLTLEKHLILLLRQWLRMIEAPGHERIDNDELLRRLYATFKTLPERRT